MSSSYAMVVSLGCVKNLVDSETLTPQLIDAGYRITSDPSLASLLVVNTCGFLESAVSEAVQTILELSQYKTTGVCKHLVVTGCMVQRYGKKLLDLLPEVDLLLGTSHYHELGEAIRELKKRHSRQIRISRPQTMITGNTPRMRSTPFYSAYVKIAEGCSNSCSFCMIPHLRGPYRSRTIEDVVQEASRLSEEGVVELNLIAQDITAFGHDHGNRTGLTSLLKSLDDIEGIEWIRLLYAYPSRITEELLQAMQQSRKVSPYLDMPLQHCVPSVLRSMHREESIPDMEDLIELIRSYIPDIALRTSLMVGFPGETESDFLNLVRFVEQVEFDHVGVFAFSPESGSRAAKLPGQIPVEIKEERQRTLMELQRNISQRRLKQIVGKTLPVLVEGPHPETELLLVGRLPTQAPEVDGTVIITKGTGYIGRIMAGRITASHDYDLEVELLPESSIPDGALCDRR
jgi:ribosomal protein S12 methylthiotransferase